MATISDPCLAPAKPHKALMAAVLRLQNYTQKEAAAAAGLGKRTLERYEKCSWWAEYLQLAEDEFLGELVGESRRTVLSAVKDKGGTKGDSDLAFKVLERRIDRLAPPRQRGEAPSGFDVDPEDLTDEELERLVDGESILKVIAETRGRRRAVDSGE